MHQVKFASRVKPCRLANPLSGDTVYKGEGDVYLNGLLIIANSF